MGTNLTVDFRFGPKAAKEIGEVFTVPAYHGKRETWKVLRERLELQPFAGGQRIYTCERIAVESG